MARYINISVIICKLLALALAALASPRRLSTRSPLMGMLMKHRPAPTDTNAAARVLGKNRDWFVPSLGSARTIAHQHRDTDIDDSSKPEVHVDVAAGEPLVVQCEINGFSVPAVVDTGAQMSVMSEACARRCHLGGSLDTRFQGRAVGIGRSDILGRLSALPLRIGPIHFRSKVSVLRHSAVDLLLGMDLLGHFQSEINVHERWMKLRVGRRTYKVHFARMPSFADLATSAPTASSINAAEHRRVGRKEDGGRSSQGSDRVDDLKEVGSQASPPQVSSKARREGPSWSPSRSLYMASSSSTSLPTTPTPTSASFAAPSLSRSSLLHRIVLSHRNAAGAAGGPTAVLRGGYATPSSDDSKRMHNPHPHLNPAMPNGDDPGSSPEEGGDYDGHTSCKDHAGRISHEEERQAEGLAEQEQHEECGDEEPPVSLEGV